MVLNWNFLFKVAEGATAMDCEQIVADAQAVEHPGPGTSLYSGHDAMQHSTKDGGCDKRKNCESLQFCSSQNFMTTAGSSFIPEVWNREDTKPRSTTQISGSQPCVLIPDSLGDMYTSQGNSVHELYYSQPTAYLNEDCLNNSASKANIGHRFSTHVRNFDPGLLTHNRTDEGERHIHVDVMQYDRGDLCTLGQSTTFPCSNATIMRRGQLEYSQISDDFHDDSQMDLTRQVSHYTPRVPDEEEEMFYLVRTRLLLVMFTC